MEETAGAPSSFAALSPRRLRASSRDGGGVVNRPPSPLTMLLSRHTRRRASIATLAAGGALSLAVRAQERMRRVGLMQPLAEDDPEGQPRIAAVREALHEGTPLSRSQSFQ